MLFNSLTYLVFLAGVVVLYWRLPVRPRLWLVLIASCVFYGFWRLEFLPLLLLSAVMDYWLARWIDATENNSRRKHLLIISIVANLSILFFFKYLIFFRDATYSLAALAGYQPGFVELNIILPLGISFYIFATISYVIDVYRREYPAERDLLLYVCFVVYFPHLVAGPILRARSLIPQLKERPPFDLALVSTGIARIVAGLFLKVVIADPIGAIVNEGFARVPASLTGLDSWTLSFLFGFQIYFDFAAYSHIAIGSALLMGIVLPENFNWPYIAATPREFWRRWHISLSTWIRDYVYLPMAGSYRRQGNDAIAAHASAPQAGLPREQRTLPLFATWALMGLWHGANWTFVVWGVYHAAIIWLHRQASRFGLKVPIVVAWAITLPLMMAGWVAFRSLTLMQALTMWRSMVDPAHFRGLTLLPAAYTTAASTFALMLAAAWVYHWLMPRLNRDGTAFRVLALGYYTVGFAGIVLFLRVTSQFIYFQF